MTKQNMDMELEAPLLVAARGSRVVERVGECASGVGMRKEALQLSAGVSEQQEITAYLAQPEFSYLALFDREVREEVRVGLRYSPTIGDVLAELEKKKVDYSNLYYRFDLVHGSSCPVSHGYHLALVASDYPGLVGLPGLARRHIGLKVGHPCLAKAEFYDDKVHEHFGAYHKDSLPRIVPGFMYLENLPVQLRLPVAQRAGCYPTVATLASAFSRARIGYQEAVVKTPVSESKYPPAMDYLRAVVLAKRAEVYHTLQGSPRVVDFVELMRENPSWLLSDGFSAVSTSTYGHWYAPGGTFNLLRTTPGRMGPDCDGCSWEHVFSCSRCGLDSGKDLCYTNLMDLSLQDAVAYCGVFPDVGLLRRVFQYAKVGYKPCKVSLAPDAIHVGVGQPVDTARFLDYVNPELRVGKAGHRLDFNKLFGGTVNWLDESQKPSGKVLVLRGDMEIDMDQPDYVTGVESRKIVKGDQCRVQSYYGVFATFGDSCGLVFGGAVSYVSHSVKVLLLGSAQFYTDRSVEVQLEPCGADRLLDFMRVQGQFDNPVRLKKWYDGNHSVTAIGFGSTYVQDSTDPVESRLVAGFCKGWVEPIDELVLKASKDTVLYERRNDVVKRRFVVLRGFQMYFGHRNRALVFCDGDVTMVGNADCFSRLDDSLERMLIEGNRRRPLKKLLQGFSEKNYGVARPGRAVRV